MFQLYSIFSIKKFLCNIHLLYTCCHIHLYLIPPIGMVFEKHIDLNQYQHMKKWILSVCVAVAAFTVSAQTTPTPAENKNQAEITFEKEVHDFGPVLLNQPATYTFTFKNTGKEPLIITNAAASCGCTTPEWTKEPILPGKKGFVKATFNAATLGQFNKAVNVASNAKTANVTLYIKGDVKNADQMPAAAPKK